MLKRFAILSGAIFAIAVGVGAQGPRRVALGDWPEMRGPEPRRHLERDRPAREVGAERRELPVARAVRRPLGADRHGQPRLRAEPGRAAAPSSRSASWRSTPTPARWSGNTSSISSRATCRRTASAGRRPPPILKPATSTRSSVGAHGHRAQPRRQAAVGPLDRRRVRRLHHARRPHDVADHRRRPGDRQRRDLELGRDRRTARHRFIALDKRTGEIVYVADARRPPVRHRVRVAASSRRSTACGCSSPALGDGAIHAIKPQTGEKVWSYVASKRAINTGVVVSGTTVIVSHGDENLDDIELGMIAAIDGSQTGDIKSHEVGGTRGPSSASRRRSSTASASTRSTAARSCRPSTSTTGKELWTPAARHAAEGAAGPRRRQDLRRHRKRQVLHRSARAPIAPRS